MNLANPHTRYVLRALFAGVLVAASALKAYLPGLSVEDWIDVVVSGVLAVGAYAGVGYATPLEPSVGRGSGPPTALSSGPPPTPPAP